MGFWNDIKQRRITQIFIGYLAGGWIALSVFDQFADRGVVPDVVYEIALVVYLFGIPTALILGWHHGEKGRQKTTPFELAQLGTIALACLATSAWVFNGWQEEQARDQLLTLDSSFDLRTVATLYFESASPELEPVATGLTEALIERLSEVRDLDVISARGTEQFKGSGLAPDSIATLLRAGTVIEGYVSERGDELRLEVELIDGESGTTLERFVLDYPADDPVAAADQLPGEVALRFREVLGEEIDLRQARRSTDSAPAWLLVQRAKRIVDDAEDAGAHGNADEALRLYAVASDQLREATDLDVTWPEPHVALGWIAYATHAYAHDADDFRTALEEAIAHAVGALERSRTHAEALELRGIARYRLWLAGLETSRDRQEALLTGARDDLERAIRLDDGRARAHNAVSHLYASIGQPSQAMLAARKAYEEDAYLEAVEQVLQRLFTFSYDLEEYGQAREWCGEGYRRFPNDYRFVRCQILSMTMPAAQPDVETAWELLEEMRPLVPEGGRALTVAHAKVAVGAVIGRAGLPDSADVVMAQARREAETIDPQDEVLVFEAAMRSAMGQNDRALDLLETYALRHPGHFGTDQGLHWWYAGLRDDPRFRSIREAN